MTDTMASRAPRPAFVRCVLAAVFGVMFVTMGARQATGLFVKEMPLHTSLTVVQMSFAAAMAQIGWGAAQPFAAEAARRIGYRKILLIGLAILSVGWGSLFVTSASPLLLYLCLGLMTGLGAGVASFSVLTAACSYFLPSADGPRAALWINLGGAFGQFFFPPIVQSLISTVGWGAAADTMALAILFPCVMLLPLAREEGRLASCACAAMRPSHLTTRFFDRDFQLIQWSFITCGFHIAFLMTHLPGEVSLCGFGATTASLSLAIIGIANIIGILGVGRLARRIGDKGALAFVYALRSLVIFIYVLAPRSETSYAVFAFFLGLTWLSTVPPTVALLKTRFDAALLPTMFGIALFTHQVGGFLGAWSGGLVLQRFGDFSILWRLDIALAALAAVFCIAVSGEPAAYNRELAHHA